MQNDHICQSTLGLNLKLTPSGSQNIVNWTLSRHFSSALHYCKTGTGQKGQLFRFLWLINRQQPAISAKAELGLGGGYWVTDKKINFIEQSYKSECSSFILSPQHIPRFRFPKNMSFRCSFVVWLRKSTSAFSRVLLVVSYTDCWHIIQLWLKVVQAQCD